LDDSAASRREDAAQTQAGGERAVIDEHEFLEIIKENRASKSSPFRLGSIDAAYASGNPKVLFDGETVVSTKAYLYLSAYQPAASDRVVLMAIGGSYVVIGKFTGDVIYGAGTALPATTGTMTATMDGSIKNITPTGSCVFNASGGREGQRVTFEINTFGTTSFTMTWGTGFKSQGALSTGTADAKTFTVSFIHDGAQWSETGRTAAM
jgi:hypothetical protein